jgi:hypothetical protein
MVMVAVGGFSCEILRVENRNYGVETNFGFTIIELDGACVELGEVSAPFKAGHAFTILSTVLGVLTVISAVLTSFVRFPPRVVVGMSVLAFVVAAFSLLVTGIGFADGGCDLPEITCKPGSMMYVVMVGALFWIGAGIAFLFVRKYEREEIMDEDANAPLPAIASVDVAAIKNVDETPTTLIETTTNSDGTKTRTTTVTSYKDGQKVVETTNETV